MILLKTVENHLGKEGRAPVWRFPEEKKEFQLPELYARALDYARTFVSLGVQPGDRVSLMLNNCSDYISFLLALWKTGAIPVPLNPYSGLHSETFLNLLKIEMNCGVNLFIFGDDANSEMINAWSVSGKRGYKRADFTALKPEQVEINSARAASEDIALIQYSSGSTGDPKGIVVTHGMIMHQLRQLDAAYRGGCKASGVASSGSWLPFNHDMGLFIGILQPLFLWCDNILASPRYYMYKPKRWFALMAEHGVDLNFTTNSAMANSFRSLAQLKTERLDLSRLYIYFGAEKVLPGTLKKTYEVFRAFGMPEEHFKVGYGMAENTLGAASTGREPIRTLAVRMDDTDTVREAGPGDKKAAEIVSIGRPHIETKISICDEGGNRLPEMRVGEICVKSPCVMPGYYNSPAATKQVLADGRLKTRDLGFHQDGEFYFCSRKDDMLVIGGRNISPEDIENCAEKHAFVVPGGTALVAIENKAGEKNELLLLVEPERSREAHDFAGKRLLLQTDIYEKTGVLVNRIAFCGRNVIKKTTSGKKRRNAIRSSFLAGVADILYIS